MIDVIHVDVCPECRTSESHHMMDPPAYCLHEYERYLPELYIRLDDVVGWLRHSENTIWDPGSRLERTVLDELCPEERAKRERGV